MSNPPQPIKDVARSICYIHIAYGCKLSLLFKAVKEELFSEWCDAYLDGVWEYVIELCNITYEQTFYEDDMTYQCIRDYVEMRHTAYRYSDAWADIYD